MVRMMVTQHDDYHHEDDAGSCGKGGKSDKSDGKSEKSDKSDKIDKIDPLKQRSGTCSSTDHSLLVSGRGFLLCK